MKFTAVIPTLNRAETLAHTLQSCIVQNDDDFEILVSDNLSNDNTAEVLADYRSKDNRIRVVRPEARLGQSSHWEFALSQVGSGMVMILGADDALLPRCMSRARAALRKQPSAKILGSTASVIYFYPNAGGNHGGRLSLIDCEPVLEVRSSKEWLHKVINGDVRITDIPYPYGCAWMDISLLRAVEKSTGRLIPCRTPPVFMALAGLAYTDSYVHVDPGFACPGVSAQSIGYSLQHSHGDREKDKEFFKETNIQQRDVPFHPKVGDSRAEHMHVAETVLMAQELGVLPVEPSIPWPKFIAMAYRDFQFGEWNEKDHRENIDSLKKVSANMGCPEVIELALSSKSLAEWKTKLSFEVPEPVLKGGTLSVDTTPMGLAGVHEAARLADGVLQAAAERRQKLKPSTDGLSADHLMMWLLASVEETGAVRDLLSESTIRSNRRAAERDKYKKEVARLKEKIQTQKRSDQKQGAFLRSITNLFKSKQRLQGS